MVRERAKEPRKLQVVQPHAAQAPVLDLSDGLRFYVGIVRQARELQAIADEMRGHILRTMEQNKISHFEHEGLKAIRQIRRLPPRINEQKATQLLAREGRLAEAQREVLDPQKATAILTRLRAQGKITEQEDPFGEAREIEALIVRTNGRETKP